MKHSLNAILLWPSPLDSGEKKNSLRNLHIAYKMWQTVFSKSRFYLKKKISLPTCSPKLPHHSPIKTWYLFLFSWIWDGPSSLWPTQHIKSNTVWITRVGHQKDISFCLVLLGHALWGKIATTYEVQLPWDEHTGEATRKQWSQQSQPWLVWSHILPWQQTVRSHLRSSRPGNHPLCYLWMTSIMLWWVKELLPESCQNSWPTKFVSISNGYFTLISLGSLLCGNSNLNIN